MALASVRTEDTDDGKHISSCLVYRCVYCMWDYVPTCVCLYVYAHIENTSSSCQGEGVNAKVS